MQLYIQIYNNNNFIYHVFVIYVIYHVFVVSSLTILLLLLLFIQKKCTVVCPENYYILYTLYSYTD